MRMFLELLVCGEGKAGIKQYVIKYEYHPCDFTKHYIHAEHGARNSSLPKEDWKKVMSSGKSFAKFEV